MTTVVVVADDLIWASRLTDAVRRAGFEPRRSSGSAAVAGLVSDRGDAGAIVDMALMTAEPMAAIAALSAAGIPVLAVANHEDAALRKRALAAGAGKVLAYRKLHEDGPAVISAWQRALAMSKP